MNLSLESFGLVCVSPILSQGFSMLETGAILFFSFGYMGLLFGIAYYGDKHADLGRSLISNPYIYALSLAVYCTAWTFYGSVGRAAHTGIGFLTVYIGPTLMFTLGWLVLRKILRISKVHRITSIADFIGSRYGKSATLSGVVTIIAVVGIIPYISLQLKAISAGFNIIKEYPHIIMPTNLAQIPILGDTAFYIAMLLAVFALLFGTRHLEATERHEGLVAAIAFESLVKLIAFVAVGIFVTYYIYDGFADIMSQGQRLPQLQHLMTLDTDTLSYLDWSLYIFLSMMAIVFLPRQFQVAVVENVNEEHLQKALWLFPLYLFVINVFVLPIAFGGVMLFPDGQVDADTFVLTLPMLEKREGLALLVFIGGMSASTGMVIVETIALSTMICNDLVMPVLLRLPFLELSKRSDISNLLLSIRRSSIVLVLLLGYAHYRVVGEFYALVSIGLVSFVAVAQFAPAILGGIFWKGGTRIGALGGLVAGFIVWGYTLVLPTLVQAGLFPERFVTHGPWGWSLLKPFQLFGLQGFDHIAHAIFWSMLANIGAYVGGSVFSRPTAIEHTQATLFVDVFKRTQESGKPAFWSGTASVPDLKTLLIRFLGRQRTETALRTYAQEHHIDWENASTADAGLVSYAEKLLASVIGSASAHVMVATVVKSKQLRIEEVMDILDETRQVIAYSRKLEKATAELQAANERLKELDRLKDEFISTVTHELKTPLTSVRALAEILQDNPDISAQQHQQFTAIIIKEIDRLTRLIIQVLEFQKIESGKMEWHIASVDFREVIQDACNATRQPVETKQIRMQVNCPEKGLSIEGDKDRLVQVMVNLISNAVKFCQDDHGMIWINAWAEKNRLRVDVKDNGIGIRPQDQEIIFEEFRQIKHASKGRPAGTGLGLPITRRIITHHGGRIWVTSEPNQGATFAFYLPFPNLTKRINLWKHS